MSQVTARFYVAEITSRAHDPEAGTVKLQPAYNNGKGNEAWAKATPSGSIELNINNPSAVAWFRDRMTNREDVAITFEAAVRDNAITDV